ncbi:MAG TPA: hypothetical protein VHD90_17665 [Phototrophicaceae bacterium]|nr:hypothetical protein [Phototrophicaceae bacterium]
MTQEMDQIIELDFGYLPEAAVSGAVLIETEQSTFLTFNVTQLMADGYHRENAGTALVEFPFCIRTQFGHPNDEARWKHPRYSKFETYGIYEVLNSSWIAQIRADNRFSFPDVPTWGDMLRHFVFTFHDSTFECVAVDIKFEVVNQRYKQTLARITKRILSE